MRWAAIWLIGLMPIRPATPADIFAIATIWNAVIRDTVSTFTTIEKTPAMLADLLAKQPVLVLESSQIDGFATYGPFRAGPGYAHTAEHSIYLAPNTRRCGLGTALLDALETQARAADIHVMIAGMADSNTTAIAFHAARGYGHVGHLPEVGRKHGAWHDLILMQKIL